MCMYLQFSPKFSVFRKADCDSIGECQLSEQERHELKRRTDALDRCYRNVEVWHELGERVRDFVEELESNETIPASKIETFALCMMKLSNKIDRVAEIMAQLKEAIRMHKFKK